MNSHYELVEVRATVFEAGGKVGSTMTIDDHADGLWLLPDGCANVYDCFLRGQPFVWASGPAWYFDMMPVVVPGRDGVIEADIDRHGVVDLFTVDVKLLRAMAHWVSNVDLAHGESVSFVVVYQVAKLGPLDGKNYGYHLAGLLDFEKLQCAISFSVDSGMVQG